MAELRLKIDPTGVVSGSARAESALDRVQKEAIQTEKSLDRVGRGANRAGRSMGLASNGMRQASMQLSQVAQQGAVTGNYLQALMVQIPDLALGFGTIGIVAGALVPVLYGVAQGFLGAGDSAEETSDRLDDLSGAVREYKQAADLARSSAAELTAEFGSQGEALRGTLELLQSIALSKALDTLNVSMAQLDTGRIRKLVKIISHGKGEIEALNDNYNSALAELQDKFGLTADSAIQLMGALEGMKSASGPEEISNAARVLNTLLLEIYGNVQNIPEEFRDMAEAAAQSDVAAAAIIATMEGVTAATSGAVSEAYKLAEAYGVSLGIAQQLAGLGKGAGDGNTFSGFEGNDPRNPNSTAPIFTNTKTFTGGYPKVKRGGGGAKRGGGGGVSAAEQAQREYDSLIRSLDPVQRAAMEFADAQESVNKALSAGVITAAEAAHALELSTKRFDESTAAAQEATGVWADFQQAGGSAIDRLIDGTASLKDALKDMIKQLVIAITKKNLLGKIQGGSASDSLGGLIFKGLLGGLKLFDSGGTLPMGQSGIVGEYGPERIQSTTRGAVITSRADTARKSSGGGGVTISIDARGAQQGVAEQIDAKLRAVAPQIVGESINAVKSNWGAFNDQYRTDGALV